MQQHDYGRHRRNHAAGASADLFPATVERVCKCIRLLTSPVDGEALAACRALLRVLNEAGSDVHHLADAIAAGWRDPAPPIAPDPRPSGPHQWWNQLAYELLQYPELLLGDREYDFLVNMERSRFTPTPGQQKWMRDIRARQWQQAAG